MVGPGGDDAGGAGTGLVEGVADGVADGVAEGVAGFVVIAVEGGRREPGNQRV